MGETKEGMTATYQQRHLGLFVACIFGLGLRWALTLYDEGHHQIEIVDARMVDVSIALLYDAALSSSSSHLWISI
jgi:hypothetical protein